MPDKAWWYLSFSDGKWKGFCILEDISGPAAVLQAHRRNINPGGEVIFFPIPDPPKEFCDKLFTTVEDVRKFDIAMGSDGTAVSSIDGREM